MRYGVTMFATDLSMPVHELAVEAEARGFDSIYIPEHTHIPTTRKTPPATGDEVLNEDYKRTLDPLVALAAAATLTSTIRLGTGVMLPAQREPIVTAKAIATLQNLSGGRFCFGVGFGWNQDEMESHGVDYRTRRARMLDHMRIMKALWTDEKAAYEGTYASLPESWSWPKPQVEVPVLLGGGAGPKLFAHIAEYGHGWIPIGGAGLTENIATFKRAMDEAGRDPESMEIVPFGSIPSPEKLEHFERIGVTEVVFRVPAAARDEVLATLDEQADLLPR